MTGIIRDIQESRNGSEHISRVFEAVQVDRRAPRGVAGQRKAGLDCEACDDEAGHDNEADDADGPSEAYDGYQVLEEDGEDDPARRPAAHDDPDGRCSVAAEPVADDGDGWVEPG